VGVSTVWGIFQRTYCVQKVKDLEHHVVVVQVDHGDNVGVVGLVEGTAKETHSGDLAQTLKGPVNLGQELVGNLPL
jgi:hypothetical protein